MCVHFLSILRATEQDNVTEKLTDNTPTVYPPYSCQLYLQEYWRSFVLRLTRHCSTFWYVLEAYTVLLYSVFEYIFPPTAQITTRRMLNSTSFGDDPNHPGVRKGVASDMTSIPPTQTFFSPPTKFPNSGAQVWHYPLLVTSAHTPSFGEFATELDFHSLRYEQLLQCEESSYIS